MNKISSKSCVPLVYVVLIFTTIIAYEPIIHNDFVRYDDYEYVVENPHVNRGISWESAKWAFQPYEGNWHPLTWLSHMLDCELFGLNPFWHHLTNLWFHIANTLLLFWILKRTTGAVWPSSFVAAAFALHPLHVESVAWVAERKDVLSGFLWMLTIAAYIWYAERFSIGRYLLVIFVFCLALMAKPMVVSLPFVLLLLDYWPLRRFQWGRQNVEEVSRESESVEFSYQRAKIHRLVVEKIPLFALVVVSCVVTYIVEQSGGAMRTLEHMPVYFRIANAIVSYSIYIGKMIYPSGLTVLYPHPGYSLPILQPIVSFVILVSISLCVIYLGRRYRYLVVGWLWYLGTLVPVIDLVPIGEVSITDHFTYLPSIGFFIMFAWSVAELVGRRRNLHIAVGVTASAALFALLICARVQVGYWRNSLSLFGRALAVTEENATAHNNYAFALREKGRFKEAIEHYKEAQRINPQSLTIMNNMARILIEQGRVEEGIVYLNDILRSDPNNTSANFNYGLAMIQQENYADAIKHFNKVLQEKPDWPEAYYCLGSIYYQLGRNDEAIQNFNEALQLNPNYTGALAGLGMVLKSQGNINEAVKKWEEALEIEPGQAEAHYNLGIVMTQQGRDALAVRHFNESLRGGPFRPEAYYWLGVIYYRHGEYELSIRNFNQALRFDRDNPDIIHRLAMTMEKQGKSDEAIKLWNRVVELEPGHSEANFNLGLVLTRQMKYDEAIGYFDEALKAKPDWAEVYYYLGLAYAQQDNYEQAVGNYKEALRLKGDLVDALNNLAWLFATAGVDELRNPSEAVKLAEQACELTKYEQADLLDTLAVAYSAAGRFSPAIETSEKAIEIAEKTGQKQLAEEIRNRLQLYKANQPYVERP